LGFYPPSLNPNFPSPLQEEEQELMVGKAFVQHATVWLGKWLLVHYLRLLY
jgi:hypothetical protein